MGISISDSKLITRRKELERELIRIVSIMSRITVSRVYRKCGNPKCKRCREEGGNHGPFMNVAYREGDKTKGFYVPVGFEDKVESCHRAWIRFREISNEIGDINREILRLKLKGDRKVDKYRLKRDEDIQTL